MENRKSRKQRSRRPWSLYVTLTEVKRGSTQTHCVSVALYIANISGSFIIVVSILHPYLYSYKIRVCFNFMYMHIQCFFNVTGAINFQYSSNVSPAVQMLLGRGVSYLHIKRYMYIYIYIYIANVFFDGGTPVHLLSSCALRATNIKRHSKFYCTVQNWKKKTLYFWL